MQAEGGVDEEKAMELNLDREAAIIEAVLFLESEPVSAEAIAQAARLSADVVEQGLGVLREKYALDNSGIELSLMAGGYILSPKKDVWDSLKERYGRKGEGRLSKAALETLSIIAYSQPVTRAEIEAIRGVSADNMIRLLSERNLIREVGKKDVPGKPVQFGTTKEFLVFFHLNSISELPELDKEESERFRLAR